MIDGSSSAIGRNVSRPTRSDGRLVLFSDWNWGVAGFRNVFKMKERIVSCRYVTRFSVEDEERKSCRNWMSRNVIPPG